MPQQLDARQSEMDGTSENAIGKKKRLKEVERERIED